MAEYEALIIGGGPAGLAAASTLVRQSFKIVLFDSHQYHNEGAQHMHTVPGWDHAHPDEFRKTSRQQLLEHYDTLDFQNIGINSVKRIEGGTCLKRFEAVDANGKSWYGAKVVLATGVEDILPDVPGFREAWPTGIFHCLFCHGYEDRAAKSSGILTIPPMNMSGLVLHLARGALRLTQNVTLYSGGDENLRTALESDLANTNEASKARFRIDNKEIARLEKGPNKSEMIIHFKDGSTAIESFLTYHPPTKLRGTLHEQLGVKLTATGKVVVEEPFGETSEHGVFAAGDMASMMEIINNAAKTGAGAAAGAALQIQAEDAGQKPFMIPSK